MTNGNDSVNFVPDKVANCGAIIDFGAVGLTKREYFAAVLLQGLLANSVYPSSQKVSASDLVQSAVGAAKMLIEELNKGVK
jgi:hypothetical protein